MVPWWFLLGFDWSHNYCTFEAIGEEGTALTHQFKIAGKVQRSYLI